jgi:hypothetical protein
MGLARDAEDCERPLETVGNISFLFFFYSKICEISTAFSLSLCCVSDGEGRKRKKLKNDDDLSASTLGLKTFWQKYTFDPGCFQFDPCVLKSFN